MRIMLTMTCLLVSLAGCATAPLQQDPDQRFTQLAEQLWQAETALTASEPDRMPDMSPAALSARQQQRAHCVAASPDCEASPTGRQRR